MQQGPVKTIETENYATARCLFNTRQTRVSEECRSAKRNITHTSETQGLLKKSVCTVFI